YALRTVRVLQFGEHLHLVEQAHGGRGQAVAAALVPRKRGAIEQQHRAAAAREVVRGGRTGRTSAGDDNIGVDVPAAGAHDERSTARRARFARDDATGPAGSAAAASIASVACRRAVWSARSTSPLPRTIRSASRRSA